MGGIGHGVASSPWTQRARAPLGSHLWPPVASTTRDANRSSRNGLLGLRYDPPCGCDSSDVTCSPVAPPAWTGTEDRSHRACAGVGSRLVPQCSRRPPAGTRPRGNEESGKPNANNCLDALCRGWRRSLDSYIARTRRVWVIAAREAQRLATPSCLGNSLQGVPETT